MCPMTTRRCALLPAVTSALVFALRSGAQEAGPDFGFTAITQRGGLQNDPANPEIGAGPSDLFLMTNSEVAVYRKNGDERYSSTLRNFWVPVGAQYKVFDPVCFYDPGIDRFFAAACEVGLELSQNFLLLAVSDDSTAEGKWHKYRIPLIVPQPYDFPTLGVDSQALYVPVHIGRSNRRIYIFDKAALASGEAPTQLTFLNPGNSEIGVGGCKRYTQSPGGYFIRTRSDTDNALRLFAIRNPLSNPQLSSFDLEVPPFTFAPGAPQKGTSDLIESGGTPLGITTRNIVERDGFLWTAHLVAPDRTSSGRVRWYQIQLNGWPASGETPTLAQSGELTSGSGTAATHTYFPDVHVDGAGNAVVLFNTSSTTAYVDIRRTVRSAQDPAGLMRSWITQQVSDGPKLRVDEEDAEFGDYTSLDEDPAAPGLFWGHAEYYSASEGKWKTWVSRIDLRRSLALSVTPTTSALRPGRPVMFRVRSAAPQSEVSVFYTQAGLGDTYIPDLEVSLELNQPELLAVLTTSAQGEASSFVRLPSVLAAGEVLFQAAQFANRSNVVSRTIKP